MSPSFSGCNGERVNHDAPSSLFGPVRAFVGGSRAGQRGFGYTLAVFHIHPGSGGGGRSRDVRARWSLEASTVSLHNTVCLRFVSQWMRRTLPGLGHRQRRVTPLSAAGSADDHGPRPPRIEPSKLCLCACQNCAFLRRSDDTTRHEPTGALPHSPSDKRDFVQTVDSSYATCTQYLIGSRRPIRLSP